MNLPMLDRAYNRLQRVIASVTDKTPTKIQEEDITQYHVDFFYNDPYENSSLDSCARVQRDYERLAGWIFSTIPKCDLQHKALSHLRESMMCAMLSIRLNKGKVK